MIDVITGNLCDLKKYVDVNLINISEGMFCSKIKKEKYLVFPEHYQSFEQQRYLINVLEKNNMKLNVITNSPFIISDVKQINLFILDEKQKLNQSTINTYGMSLEMIYYNLFNEHKSIGQKSFEELEDLRLNIINDKITKSEALKELSNFADSFEKTNVIGILREKEKNKDLSNNFQDIN